MDFTGAIVQNLAHFRGYRSPPLHRLIFRTIKHVCERMGWVIMLVACARSELQELNGRFFAFAPRTEINALEILGLQHRPSGLPP